MKIDTLKKQITELHEKLYDSILDKSKVKNRDEIISKMKGGIFSQNQWCYSENKDLEKKIYSRSSILDQKIFPFFSLDEYMVFLGDSILFIGSYREITGPTFGHEFYSLTDVIEKVKDGEGIIEKNGEKKIDYVKNKSKIYPFKYSLGIPKIDDFGYNFLINYCEKILLLFDKFKEEEEKIKEEEEKIRIKNLKVSQSNVLSELDKDGNGEVDVIEGNDFNLLFKKHQNLIKEIDKKHIQEFVKVSSYLKTKKNNIQLIFKSIRDTPNEETLSRYVEILKDDIHSYNLVLFNSLNMIVSLVEDDTFTFYEIHEMFDNLNIFDSKHERDVSQKLNNIGDGLKELMYSIEEMGINIERQMGELSYVTEQSNRLLENQLQSIDSSIKSNNLLTGINAYQTYKLRKGK